jgi:hypothetical protein
MRELETICEFLTGQGLFSGLDFIFTFVFIAVLFAYSATLAWIVIASIPLYIAIAFLIRTFLKERIDEKFDRSVNRAGFTGRLPAAPLVGEVATSRVKVHRPLAHGPFMDTGNRPARRHRRPERSPEHRPCRLPLPQQRPGASSGAQLPRSSLALADGRREPGLQKRTNQLRR